MTGVKCQLIYRLSPVSYQTMKKTKIENNFNAFFDAENFSEKALIIARDSALLKGEKTSRMIEKADEYFTLFKKMFLFLPGVLILHLATFAAVNFYQDIGLNLWMLFWFASGIFMTWAGIGDLRNKRHWLIPASVILSAAIIAGLGNWLSPDNSEYSFYLMPLLFIVPVLVRSLADQVDKEIIGV